LRQATPALRNGLTQAPLKGRGPDAPIPDGFTQEKEACNGKIW